MNYATLSDKNQFTFTCPVFNVETKMKSCVTLRHLVYQGKRPEVRRGCQACMSAGKCPAAVVVARIAFDTKGITPDEYGADAPTKGKLCVNVLERVSAVIVPDSALNNYMVPDAERVLIETSNTRIVQQLATAPLTAGTKRRTASTKFANAAPPRATSKPVTAPAASGVEKAATTGDMSAAINSGE